MVYIIALGVFKNFLQRGEFSGMVEGWKGFPLSWKLWQNPGLPKNAILSAAKHKFHEM